MKRIIAIGIILLFIGMSISSSTGFNLEKDSTFLLLDGKTLYVGGSGPGNYTKIQDAIDNASDGDTVFVYNGTYYENINVYSAIRLIGEDKNTTIIDGSHKEDNIVTIYWPSNVTITGFTIQNSVWNGIVIDSNNWSGGITHYNTIYGNIIQNTDNIGIAIVASWRNKIYRNNISNHRYGIFIAGYYGNSSYNSIYQNNIMSNKIGIHLEHVWQGWAIGNIIFQNNLFNNRHNAQDEDRNQWDNGKKGNYWDDYRGKDRDDDGIGDKPYRIRPFIRVTKDNYPLMKPYGNITCYPKKSQNNMVFFRHWIERFPLLYQFVLRIMERWNI